MFSLLAALNGARHTKVIGGFVSATVEILLRPVVQFGLRASRPLASNWPRSSSLSAGCRDVIHVCIVASYTSIELPQLVMASQVCVNTFGCSIRSFSRRS